MTRNVTQLDESSLGGRAAEEQGSGFGALQTERGCLPLVAMDVRARVTGLAADLTVRQTFRNSLEVPLEATYIFPLPDRAAVTSFRLKVADRVVEGVLKERAEARREYREAIEAGHRAAIAEEERSGTFNLRVGNIPPRETVAVELTLVGPLPFAGGEAEFRFPLVVAPRYVPGVPLDGPSVGAGTAPDTDQAPDASRVTPPVLLPGFPNPVQLSLEVELDPAGLDASGLAADGTSRLAADGTSGLAADGTSAQGNWPSRVRSSLHSIVTDSGPPWTVRLEPGQRLNRDFILRFPLAAEAVQTSLVASPGTDAEPGTLALTVVPPSPDAGARPAPRDVVFVLDRSGSMGGWKMVAARRAVGRMIDSLLEQDRFTLLAFDDQQEFPRHAEKRLIEATNRARWQALEWLGQIEARGGTEMGPALCEAARLLAPGKPARERVLVLVTDGQVAGEDAVLKSLSKAAGRQMPRIHTLGVDQAVNAGFLRRLAKAGRGTCELVESESQLDAAMDRIHRTIGRPVLTELRLEPVEGAWTADTLVPSRLPDLFADRPVTIFGRLAAGTGPLRVRVSAVDASGKPWQQEVAARPAATAALMNLWGRARVRELEDLYASGLADDQAGLAKRIVEVSLSAGVLSRFTAYVAVDRSETVHPGGKPLEVVQPVEMPEGWAMAAAPMAMAMPSPGDATKCCRRSSAIKPLAARGAPGDMLSSLFGSIFDHDSDEEALEAAAPPREVDPASTREAAAAAVRHCLRQLSGKRLLTGRKRLERLIEALEALLQVYAGEADEPKIREALARARDHLQTFDRGDRSALSHENRLALVREIGQLIDRLAPPSSEPREKFWT